MAIYKERFGNATGMTFVLVGSFTVDEIKPLAARYLGGLPSAPLDPHFRDVGLRYPPGDIDRTLAKGSDNSAVTIIFSGERPYSPAETLKLSALTEVLRLRVIDRIREELGTSYSPGVMSQFTNIPVGQYALRFSIGCAPDQISIVERAVDDIIGGAAGQGAHDRGAREGHAHVAERARCPDQDQRVLVGAAAESCTGSQSGRRRFGLRRTCEGVDASRCRGRGPDRMRTERIACVSSWPRSRPRSTGESSRIDRDDFVHVNRGYGERYGSVHHFHIRVRAGRQ